MREVGSEMSFGNDMLGNLDTLIENSQYKNELGYQKEQYQLNAGNYTVRAACLACLPCRPASE